MENKKHFVGLTDEQVQESRKKYGNNLLTPPERDPLWKLFLEKFEDPIIRILLIAAFLSLIISVVHNDYAETIGIFCAIFLATGVAFWFEMDANKKFDILNKVNDQELIKVIRNGKIGEVPKTEVVVGDIIVLETGEEVPADGELLEAVSLQIDESTLTGEPLIDKTTNPAHFHSDSTYPSNWVMRGTKVIDGHATVEVKKVGDATEFGQVAKKATEMTKEDTPLNKQLDRLAKLIGVVGFILAVLTFSVLFAKDMFFGATEVPLVQLGSAGIVIIAIMVILVKVWLPIVYDGIQLMGYDKEVPNSVENGSWFRWLAYGVVTFAVLLGIGFAAGLDVTSADSWASIDLAKIILQHFMVAVTLIVVAVPEGLPMSVTLSLAMSMRRMLKTNNLVRKMHATETMGATTVICTDKTGTLTQNQMTIYQTDFFGLRDQQPKENSNAANLIKESISANTTAHLDHSNPDKSKSLGNPTEAALLFWLHKNDIDYLELREKAEVIEQLTFSTERKYMATLVESPTLGKKVLYVKGAPEIVMSKCKDVASDATPRLIKEVKSDVDNKLIEYQGKAMRTLGFAYKIIEDETPASIKDLADFDLTFLGIVAISDPVREEVPSAVKDCHNAGIDVKIVTGDTPGTAKEIGKQIGVWNDGDTDLQIITGLEFAALSDEEALKRVQALKIMCRARPSDKQRLVQLLQQTGSVVAVTGDGTNDAPALNYAHVGLSMGSGTSVAKEASDITLLDDSFNSIATAVMWGRSLYQNIQRFILFQLTINVAALSIVFLGSLMGFELPLTVTQMLWVNLIMDTFAAAALASLPPDHNVMKSKPRHPDDFIITPVMSKNILFVGFSFVVLLVGMLFYFTKTDGEISAYHLSVFFTVFVMLQFWNLFNAKAYATGKSAFHELDKGVGFIIVGILIVVGQFMIVEFGGEVFRTVPISLNDWGIIIAATSPVLWIGEISRLIKK
ncbi:MULTISPECIES: calcium-translocating P-type ATPase, PMCA-type [unclassified Imperialibacter]|uniref:calcium-translocating P-type ATPase, PMCA-type n=1 Tax=unclassified Imperialibacter TaxID=2629706 RepID=UPI001257FD7A|nr:MULTISPECIES: calcium-translocating P-type ATPase, PMCA-type [unclassified Imperialibacter]CAD5257339.1 Plasma-membrane calcium-translocating P-type ATPase [Imperialibacter sp. 75]CAD5260217.1 Plasma-membrane calcium-translocating P-type ATPase [Imperialibacter sp. 89]VVT25691.1 Plasma-membrane calcium-translocating P-type ATPase [Imperialibacter sp. EC-SDR9]